MPDTRSALLAAVAADPDDDAPRLIYADWLDEQGESSRAEFIRLQCRAARLPRGDDGRITLERRADDLLLEHERAWLGPWHEQLVRWEFRRGYVHAATVTSSVFRAAGAALFAAEPVERLGFVDDNGDPLSAEAVPDVVTRPAFGHVRSLDILGATPARDPVGRWHLDFRNPPVPVPAWLRALAAAEHVTRLRAFHAGGTIYSTAFDVEGPAPLLAAIEAFCGASHLATLRHLNLSVHPSKPSRPGHRLMEALASAAFAPGLRRLGLLGWRLDGGAVAARLVSGDFPELRCLELCNSKLAPSDLSAVLKSPRLTRLNDVTLDEVQLPALVETPVARRLRGLTVCRMMDNTPARRPIVAAWRRLAETARPPRRLALVEHDPGDAFRTMRKTGWLRRVCTLEIRNSTQTPGCYRDAVIGDLLGSGHLPCLTRLRTHEFATDRFCEAIARWRGLARLEELTLTDDYYGRLAPASFSWPVTNMRWRRLHGLRLASDADADRLAGCGVLGGVRQLDLAFVGPVSPEALGRLFGGAALGNVVALWISFGRYQLSDGRDGGADATTLAEVYRLLADPATLPRLRTLYIGVWGDRSRTLPALRQRLGPRLKV